MWVDISSFTAQPVHFSLATKYAKFKSIIPLPSPSSFALLTTWFVTATENKSTKKFILIRAPKYYKSNTIQDKTFIKFNSDMQQDKTWAKRMHFHIPLDFFQLFFST